MESALPTSDFLTAHSGILSFIAVVVGFLAVNLIVWWAIRPSRFSEEKLTTYECGENPVGSAWIQFNIRFYVFALIFIIFDVEAVFLLPWAVVYRELGLARLRGRAGLHRDPGGGAGLRVAQGRPRVGPPGGP